jgi:hypothetical protein
MDRQILSDRIGQPTLTLRITHHPQRHHGHYRQTSRRNGPSPYFIPVRPLIFVQLNIDHGG